MGCGLIFLILAGFIWWPFWILAAVVAILSVRK